MSMEGMSMPTMDLPLMKLTADMAVTAVAPNGDITYDVAFTGMTAEAAPGMDPSLAAMMQGAADGITALKGSATISDRGVSRTTTINVDKITDPNLKQTLSAVANSLEGMSMPMPEEAVGVGAKWEVRQASKAAGAQTFQKIECELASVDAQGATIRVKLEQTAPPQGITNSALPAGSVVNIEKLAGTGTGTIALRFNSLIPTSEMSSHSHGDGHGHGWSDTESGGRHEGQGVDRTKEKQGDSMRIAGKMFLVLVLFAAVTGLSAQTTTQKPKPFEPQVGQPGKDVVWVPTPRSSSRRCSISPNSLPRTS